MGILSEWSVVDRGTLKKDGRRREGRKHLSYNLKFSFRSRVVSDKSD